MRSGENLECSEVLRADNRKVTPVQGCDDACTKAFGCRDNRRIDGSEKKIVIRGGKLRNPNPVGR